MQVEHSLVVGLAFEFLAQGVWDQEDLARFVLDRERRAFDRGFQRSASRGPARM